MNNYKQFIFYKIGEFAAKTLLKGIVQPDFKLNNLGMSRNDIAFSDFANVFDISIPEELNSENIRKISLSLATLIGDLNDCQQRVLLRSGFLARGGILAEIILSDLANIGFSSLSYIDGVCNSLHYDAVSNLQRKQIVSGINEWKELPFDKIQTDSFNTLEKYENSSLRKSVTSFTRFFLDKLYLMRYYIKFYDNKDLHIPLYINIASSALENNRKYCAFGFFQKCLTLEKITPEIKMICTLVLENLTHTQNLNLKLKHLILDNINREFLDFLWFLDDIDTFGLQLTDIL